jgi:hypothetical protein
MIDNLIEVYDANEQEIDLVSLGLIGLKLSIPSPSYETTTRKIDGGETFVIDRTLKPRKLEAAFYSKASGYDASLGLRDLLYEKLGNGQMFYVSEVKAPNRRWKVYLDEWAPKRIDVKSHRFNIPLFCQRGISESTTKTDTKFTTATFSFSNDGSVIIDPRVHSETEIEFIGPSSNLIIRNTTTGDEWSWTGDTIAGDVILLKGVKSLKNSASIFGQTNKQLITFNPGVNNLEIVGATAGQFELNIRTRFYFL